MSFARILTALVLVLLLTEARELVADSLEVRLVMHIANRDSEGPPSALIDVVWDNAWYNGRNHDAVWLFFKNVSADGGYRHLSVIGAEVISGPDDAALGVRIAHDSTGLFVEATQPYRGPVSTRLRISFQPPDPERRGDSATPQAFGIEMVYIPDGPFYAGEPDQKGVSFGAYYQADGSGGSGDYFVVRNEDAIPVGQGNDELYYVAGEYVGDAEGPIPAEFPKGTEPFYLMKYEMTQGQYADMLNTLGTIGTYKRTSFYGRSYYQDRGTIRLEGGSYIAGSPDRPMNFATWDDQLAFADWAALRPFTELEFDKASRGPGRPQAGDYPWGTSNRNELARTVNENDDVVTLGHPSESNLTEETVPVYGASYYRVMDLAGSVWERVITIGSPDGRLFKGSHGDGHLGSGARATNDDWPHDFVGREGHGYRGGGFYGHGVPVHEFNPYSPVAYRRFGAWSGGDPHRAYGFRAARSAPKD